MSKSFFDINSRNTFNNDWWFNKEESNKEWPVWLTLPVHYQSKKWSVIKSTKFVPTRTHNSYTCYLSCGHIAYIPAMIFQAAFSDRILVNCKSCGGNGEIGF